MTCEKCNKPHDGTFGSGRFCSRSCANSTTYTPERLAKLKETMKTKSSWYKGGITGIGTPCIKCGKPLLQKRIYKMCARCLHADANYRKIISIRTKGKCGGYRPTSGRGKTGKFNGYVYQSTWELAWIKFNLAHGIKFERCHESFKYWYDGKLRRNYPDFKIGEEYYEIAGWIGDQKRAKFTQFPKDKILHVLAKKEIQEYLNFIKTASSSNG